jgi:hypothetical protein
MSRETDFTGRGNADATLMATLTGGLYAYGSLGREGLTRESVPAAYDTNGYLKPVGIAKMRPLVHDFEVFDGISQEASARQVVELWLYQDSGFTAIDAALARLYTLFQGYKFSDAFPCEWAGTPVTRAREMDGVLVGMSMARQDWVICDIQN